MNVLLITIGSGGDIHPFIAIGRELQARGHRATLLVNPYFESNVRRAGLGYLPLGEEVDFKEIMAIPDAAHPRRGGITVLQQMVFPRVKEMVERTEAAIGETRPDLVVSHHIAIGASWVCEKLGVPRMTCVLSPALWLNPRDKSVFQQGMPENPPTWFMRAGLWFARMQMRRQYDRPLNVIRRDLGFGPKRDMLFSDAVDGEAVLGMWSRHFRGPLEEDPDHGVICGFPWHDDSARPGHESDDVLRFLDECERANEPPVLFSLGTAVVHVAGRFYHTAAEACRKLGRRGILLTNRSEYAPSASELPAGVRAFSYAPFSQVMPRCACSVHHGGIGTTAQGLRSGRPTVIVPHAYDQFDNAARAKRHGVSATLWATKVNVDRLATAVGGVLDDKDVAARAAALGSKIREDDGAKVAADRIERSFSSKR